MKKLIILALLFFFQSPFLLAQPDHEQNVHQYIVYNAMSLLKYRVNPLYDQTELKTYLGGFGNYTNDPAWKYDNNRVMAGVWREDDEDVIWNYSCPTFPPFLWLYTNTHFWETQDIYYNPTYTLSGNCPEPIVHWVCGPVPGTAWDRINKYIIGGVNGSWEIRKEYPGYPSQVDFRIWQSNPPQYFRIISYGPIGFKYDGLVEGNRNLYHTGYAQLTGYQNSAGKWAPIDPPVEINLMGQQKYLCYEILGRMAHCLQDMSVPAHSHLDPHPGFCGEADSYEEKMGIPGQYQQWNFVTATENGKSYCDPFIQSIHHPVKFLAFHMLQVAGYFPSNDGEPYPLYPPVSDPYNLLQGAPRYSPNIFTSYGAGGISQAHFNTIGNYCMNAAIRMTAGLFYWFSEKTAPPPPPFNPEIVCNNLPPQGSGWRLHRNQTGMFTAQNNGATNYIWEYYICKSPSPGGWPLQNYYPQYNLHTSPSKTTNPIYMSNLGIPYGTKCPPLENPADPSLYLKLQVRVDDGQFYQFSDVKQIMPHPGYIPGGCPWLFVHDSIDYLPDNNILHRSELSENIGVDITDKYVLQIQPYFNDDPGDNTCSIKIHEPEEQSYSYFDNVKLHAIDHPVGSKVGVTENNDIVIYYPNPTSPSYALNNSEDVTSELQYGTPETVVEGDEGYETTAEYSYDDAYNLNLKKNIYRVITNAYNGFRDALKEKNNMGDNPVGADSVAIIFDPYDSDFNPIVNKNMDAGIISAFDYDNQYESGDIYFSKRQYRSDVVIPLDKDLSVDYISINWNQDYSLSHLAVCTFYYDGYVEEELTLVEATKDGEVQTQQLLQIDQDYAEMDNTSDIILKFQKPVDSVQAGWVRDYVFEVTGRYVTELGDNPPVNNPISGDNLLPKEYKLYQNYPNPFNPVTTIKYDIPTDGKVTFKIYDILGKEVYSFTDYLKAGYHSFNFNASHLASGVFFYSINAGDFIQTKKMLFVK